MPNTRHLAYLVLLLLLAGCTQGTPYRTERDTLPGRDGVMPDEKPITVPAPELGPEVECNVDDTRCVQFVEFDEHGNAESREQFNKGLTAAKAAAQKNGVVVVYIHGWHHNAAVGDTDIANFHKLLAGIDSNKSATGIYVGWRGESIKSNEILGFLPSYGLTFWGRKDTAHDIGNAGAVAELLRTLSDIRSNNPESRLLIIGHSFGAAMLYSAMSDAIAEQIRRDCQRRADFPAIADLVVLVNPAFEAMRLRPLYSFARGFGYPEDQKPRLFIVTTQADFPTRVAFKVGRHIGTVFHSYPNEIYKEQDITAIGHYIPYITHQLKTVHQCTTQTDQKGFTTSGSNDPEQVCIAGKLELTRCDESKDCQSVTPNHFITRGTAGKHIPHGFPIYNIRTTKEVIPNHTEIWGEPTHLLMKAVLDEVKKDPTENNKSLAPTDCGTPTGEFLSPA
ncbi:hypothetical protein QYM18_20070 [Ectopseudomonas chengduensis]|nr:hypothetical protein [Pseudomonas chengduensis]WKC36731.1 hypothetical protein QYM18_20070 [Pseudomonas chengduensis]